MEVGGKFLGVGIALLWVKFVFFGCDWVSVVVRDEVVDFGGGVRIGVFIIRWNIRRILFICRVLFFGERIFVLRFSKEESGFVFVLVSVFFVFGYIFL